MEPEVWSAIGLGWATLAALVGLVLSLLSRIDGMGTHLGSRIDAMGADLGSRIDAQGLGSTRCTQSSAGASTLRVLGSTPWERAWTAFRVPSPC